MKYYVLSDTHGFYTETINALTEKGFFTDTEPHKLILCGDMMDRGTEAVKLQDFMLDLLRKNELIFIRGNHEDLLVDLVSALNAADNSNFFYYYNNHHWSNGTISTALQLTGIKDDFEALDNPKLFAYDIKNTPFYSELMPASVNYFETNHYIFVHGWIPCIRTTGPNAKYIYKKYSDWRNVGKKAWNTARWINGMDAAHNGITIRGKTIVCGHFHTSYGYCIIDEECSQWGPDAIFEPYYNEGIIAIDGCTAHSGIVNCIVIED